MKFMKIKNFVVVSIKHIISTFKHHHFFTIQVEIFYYFFRSLNKLQYVTYFFGVLTAQYRNL